MVLLIFDVVAGTATGIVAAAAALVLLVSLWAGLPWIARADSAGPAPFRSLMAPESGRGGDAIHSGCPSRGDAENIGMSKNLSTKDRKKLSKKSFALPGKRKYPIPDKAHARNALARVAQNGTPAEQKKVKAAVKSASRALGKRKEVVITRRHGGRCRLHQGLLQRLSLHANGLLGTGARTQGAHTKRRHPGLCCRGTKYAYVVSMVVGRNS